MTFGACGKPATFGAHVAESLWEDNLLERKVEGDLRDLLKTLVAFANTVRPGHTAVILIGERDDGTVGGVTNPDPTCVIWDPST